MTNITNTIDQESLFHQGKFFDEILNNLFNKSNYNDLVNTYNHYKNNDIFNQVLINKTTDFLFKITKKNNYDLQLFFHTFIFEKNKEYSYDPKEKLLKNNNFSLFKLKLDFLNNINLNNEEFKKYTNWVNENNLTIDSKYFLLIKKKYPYYIHNIFNQDNITMNQSLIDNRTYKQFADYNYQFEIKANNDYEENIINLYNNEIYDKTEYSNSLMNNKNIQNKFFNKLKEFINIDPEFLLNLKVFSLVQSTKNQSTSTLEEISKFNTKTKLFFTLLKNEHSLTHKLIPQLENNSYDYNNYPILNSNIDFYEKMTNNSKLNYLLDYLIKNKSYSSKYINNNNSDSDYEIKKNNYVIANNLFINNINQLIKDTELNMKLYLDVETANYYDLINKNDYNNIKNYFNDIKFSIPDFFHLNYDLNSNYTNQELNQHKILNLVKDKLITEYDCQSINYLYQDKNNEFAEKVFLTLKMGNVNISNIEKKNTFKI